MQTLHWAVPSDDDENDDDDNSDSDLDYSCT